MGTFIVPANDRRGAYRALSSSCPGAELSTTVSRGTRGAGARSRRLYSCSAHFHGGSIISYLHPLLAIVIGIVHAALAPVILIGGVKPNLVLVAVVLVTVLVGFTPGITWAFVAGLTANLLVGDPLGSVPLAMLLVAAIIAGGARVFGRAIWVYPVLAAFVGSLLADAIGLLLGQLVLDTQTARIPVELLLAAATLNAAVTALLLFPARAIARRSALDESPAW